MSSFQRKLQTKLPLLHYPQTMKAAFPLHLLMLPISTIPCSSSISGVQQELLGVRLLGQF